MDAFRHLSRVTTRVCELELLGGFLWFEIQVATGLFYLEVPEKVPPLSMLTRLRMLTPSQGAPSLKLSGESVVMD